jgi:hemerythrin-like domain-containing protein
MTHTDSPADTRMMGIVHSALRRDLVRIRLVLDSPGEVTDTRRVALAEHVLWLMGFLHQHHQGEDEGLYPQVLRKNPGAVELLETMHVDHSRIEPALTALDAAARDIRDDRPGSQRELQVCLDDMAAVLVPHLAREEQEMMPVVSDTLTDAEWRAWDQEFNIKPKAMRDLADEAHWVIDGLDDEGRRFVEHLVPPVPRFIVLRLLGGRYRRRRAHLWDGTPAASVPSLPIAAYEARNTRP